MIVGTTPRPGFRPAHPLLRGRKAPGLQGGTGPNRDPNRDRRFFRRSLQKTFSPQQTPLALCARGVCRPPYPHHPFNVAFPLDTRVDWPILRPCADEVTQLSTSCWAKSTSPIRSKTQSTWIMSQWCASKPRTIVLQCWSQLARATLKSEQPAATHPNTSPIFAR